MDVSYRKDLRHNYLVIAKPDNSDDEAYSVCMLEANSIEGIIRPEPRSIDNQVFYYYDITAKQSIDTIYVKSKINYEQLKSLFANLADLTLFAYEYLLNENDLLLDPEHVYIELASGQAFVSYIPGYGKDIGKQMTTLIEYLMNKVEYNDKDAVLYVYNLYAVCRDEGFSFNNLLSAIKESKTDKLVRSESRKGLNRSTRKDSKHEDAYGPDKDETVKKESAKEEYKPRIQIPVMMEKVSQESEIYYYPLRNYIYTGACILGAIMVLAICLNMKIVYTSMGNRIDYSKLMALLLILMIIIGYLMKIIWDKNNRLTKIISKEEYIDPRVEYSDKLQVEKKSEHIKIEDEYSFPMRNLETVKQLEDKTELTVLLNADPSSYGCCLVPEDKDSYSVIPIKDFPFVIGKQKSNVDYFIDKEVVSRYHIKITKEDDNYYITDLNSTNGTTLNDKPLSCYQRNKIINDDKVSIAGIEYSFQRSYR
ncbi:MAG: FHA domain-containing protein [Clostridiales bacterium]|nr:FHA domain-containing protein [Clostridiales bacterium]